MHTHIYKSELTRRSFLRFIGCGSFFLTVGIAVASSIRFLFPRVLFEKPTIFKIPSPEEFRLEEGMDLKIFEQWKEEQSVWIVRDRNRIYAINAKCTHLGCTPNYFPDERIFKCPCHGSQYYENGINFAGPATRPLDRLHISLDRDGKIIIDKSRIYTYKEFDRKGAYLNV